MQEIVSAAKCQSSLACAVHLNLFFFCLSLQKHFLKGYQTHLQPTESRKVSLKSRTPIFGKQQPWTTGEVGQLRAIQPTGQQVQVLQSGYVMTGCGCKKKKKKKGQTELRLTHQAPGAMCCTLISKGPRLPSKRAREAKRKSF